MVMQEGAKSIAMMAPHSVPAMPVKRCIPIVVTKIDGRVTDPRQGRNQCRAGWALAAARKLRR